MRASGRRIGRQRDGGDDLAWFKHRLDVWRCIGQPVEVDERHVGGPVGAAHLNNCIERDQRDREVGGMGGDTIVARAEHRVPTVLAADRGTA